MACILVAGTSSRQSCTVILHRFADSKVVGEARFPHPLPAPQSEQNSAFWGGTRSSAPANSCNRIWIRSLLFRALETAID